MAFALFRSAVHATPCERQIARKKQLGFFCRSDTSETNLPAPGEAQLLKRTLTIYRYLTHQTILQPSKLVDAFSEVKRARL